jgi:hypothetical protein
LPEKTEDEIELELCCEGLQQAIDDGAIYVVPHQDGYAEGILCEDGTTVVRINFCPFCGTARFGGAEELKS